MVRINASKLVVLKCLRCDYRWVSRKADDAGPPLRCAKCKSDKWDEPVTNKSQSRKMYKWHARRRVGNVAPKHQKTPT